jgi:hypothetical protein
MKTLFLLVLAASLNAADRWHEIRNAGQPAYFAFGLSVAVYPDSAIAQAQFGASTVTVSLQDGRAGVLVSSPVRPKLVLIAEGSDARGLLNEIAGGWKWLSPR